MGGSRFNIYFHSERRENRGSNQDFHEISFSKDCSLMNHDHFIILPSHAYNKNQTIKIETCVSKKTIKINYFIPNVRNKTINRTRSELPFFAIFCEFNKQDRLVHNN